MLCLNMGSLRHPPSCDKWDFYPGGTLGMDGTLGRYRYTGAIGEDFTYEEAF